MDGASVGKRDVASVGCSMVRELDSEVGSGVVVPGATGATDMVVGGSAEGDPFGSPPNPTNGG